MSKKILTTRGIYAIVDDEDHEQFSRYNWYAEKAGRTFRIARRITTSPTKSKIVYMHHFVMGKPIKGMDIDHINGNGADNRKENLRLCTHAQNCANTRKPINNTSGFKGVSWHKQTGKWRAYIRVDYKQKSLGLYETKEQAYEVYKKAALSYFKDYARIE